MPSRVRWISGLEGFDGGSDGTALVWTAVVLVVKSRVDTPWPLRSAKPIALTTTATPAPIAMVWAWPVEGRGFDTCVGLSAGTLLGAAMRYRFQCGMMELLHDSLNRWESN